MDPLQVSAQFAAYVWFTRDKPDDARTRERALCFARENWAPFLPVAQEGWGRLLIRIGRPRRARRTRAMRRSSGRSRVVMR
jgi:hypothetical protein